MEVFRESQRRAAGDGLGQCAPRLDDCSAQDTDGCPNHVWDGVEHEHQLPQAWKGHVLQAWDIRAGNGLCGPQKPSLNVTVI